MLLVELREHGVQHRPSIIEKAPCVASMLKVLWRWSQLDNTRASHELACLHVTHIASRQAVALKLSSPALFG